MIKDPETDGEKIVNLNLIFLKFAYCKFKMI